MPSFVATVMMTMTQTVLILSLLAKPSLSFASSTSVDSVSPSQQSCRWGLFSQRLQRNKNPLTTTTTLGNNVVSSLSSFSAPAITRRSRSRQEQRRRRRRNTAISSRTTLKQTTADENDHGGGDDDVSGVDIDLGGISKKQLIEITSQIELPFSPEIAYDAYSNLPRQPTWSSWLDSVVMLDKKKNDSDRDTIDDDRLASKWTMKFLGIRYSWEAVALKNERPRVMQWQSTTGLRNFGTVEFHPRSSGGDDDDLENAQATTTLMTLKMTFVAPRAVSAMFRKSGKIASYVERNLITKSLHDFRDVVVRTDLQQQQQSQPPDSSSTQT
jgi:uncharacterized membrane protein